MTMVIGGEFEIDISVANHKNIDIKFDGFFYSSGRAALYNILYYLDTEKKITKIYLPDYLCPSIIDTVGMFNFETLYYPILPNLEIDMNYFVDKNLNSAALLVINYFGGIELDKSISELKRFDSSVCIIEDNVQALCAMFNKTEADFSFTSFRKYLPVPDGGWVKSKYSGLPEYSAKNTFAAYKIAGGILKKYRNTGYIDDKIYLELFSKGEKLIDQNLKYAMSDSTAHIISTLDLNNIADKRKENASYLVKRLHELGINSIVDFMPAKVPLFVPVRIKNRNEIRKLLFENNIFCPIHWAVTNSELKRGLEMSQNELSLVIDQRYNLKDMDRIINVLEQNGNFCY
jgi:hypothetical protein